MENNKKEKSCGCVIIDDGKVLLIQQNDGSWGFPKGHMENGETEVETAIREVKEETNIDVIPDGNKRYVIEYPICNDIMKQVVLFVAKRVSNDIKAQESEINEIKWASFSEAFSTITYDNTRELLREILKDRGYDLENVGQSCE